MEDGVKKGERASYRNNLLYLVTTYNPNNPQVFHLVRKTLPMLNENSSLKSMI